MFVNLKYKLKIDFILSNNRKGIGDMVYCDL